MTEGALQGLKVLDLTHHIAGPYCTKLLADYGAEVIKVERPGGGDPTRSSGPFLSDVPHPERSGAFLHLNTNKKSITLNLKTKAGVNLFSELVKDADVVVENFSPRVMPSLGLSYETLTEINPSLVMTSISNFGQTGPYRDYKAADIVEYALGGVLYVYGDEQREPVKQYGNQAQYQGGLAGAIGTMSAVLCRDLAGFGQHVDVSIMEAVFHVLELADDQYAFNGHVRKRLLNRRISGHPMGIEPCQDGWAAISAITPFQWELIPLLMEMPELLEDPRFTTTIDRADNHFALDESMSPWLMAHTKQEIYHAGQLWRVPFGPVNTIADLFDSPQLRARGYFVEADHPAAGRLTYPGAPFKMIESPWELRHPAPLIGQHNEEIYGDYLGHSKEDLRRLREQGVI